MKFLSNLMRYLAVFLLAGILFSEVGVPAHAKTKGDQANKQEVDPEKEAEAPTIQRTPSGAFENIRNKVSNIDFYSSNYGILFLDVARGQAGGRYPRNNSSKPYLFGGGVWFGARKFVADNPDNPEGSKSLKRVSVISYNPNSGASWMVPGEITQPYKESIVEQSAEAINKYRIYFSTDYNNFTGEPLDNVDKTNNGANWPIWDSDPNETMLIDRYVGNYESVLSRRNRDTHPKGPAIVSGEDIVSIFKDTDLSRYEIGEQRAKAQGYPIGIEIDQRIYSWGFGQYQNFIYIRYSIVNKSSDTLFDCYMAPALDTDIGAAANDRMTTVIPQADQDTLDLGAQWSEVSGNDNGFGYMGADFLESPAVDIRGFIRKDKKYYLNGEQLGLHALRNWVIDIDPRTPEDRYQFMAEPIRDIDNGAGDKRFLQSTGPFNMLPGDTARIVVGLMIAPARSSAPDGSWEDMDSLITLDLFAQKVYDENFLAPRPPDPANVSWRPLDNGVELSWDEQSERSLDFVEKGLDFAGYVIQRSRKAAASDILQYDSVVGFNIGYKTIGTFQLPPLPGPDARAIAARTHSLAPLGAWWRLPMLSDTGKVYFTNSSGNRDSLAVVRFAVDCADTIKRVGLKDTIIFRPGGNCIDTVSSFLFDPYDDENNDSSLYNVIDTTHWWRVIDFGDRFKNKAIRDIVRDAITEIMDSITNGRRFIDVGDDNGDGTVTSTPDNLRTNEKLINNIDYFYRVLAYDAGSVEDNTPSKLNTGIFGINEVRARPEAPPAGIPVIPEIISMNGLGGISNFNLVVYDQERLAQLFGGDTLEFEFQPFKLWDLENGVGISPLWYTTEVIVSSHKLGELNRFIVPYTRGDLGVPVFADRGNNVFRNIDSSFVSRFGNYVRFDTSFIRDGKQIDSVLRIDSTYIETRHISGQYRNTFLTEPGRFLFGTNGVTKTTFGVVFDWAGIQFGDSIRFGKYTSDSSKLVLRDSNAVVHSPLRSSELAPFEVVDGPAGGSSNTHLIPGPIVYGKAVINSDNTDQRRDNRDIPSIGQVKLEIEFMPGGTEDIIFQKAGKTYTVRNVNYLIPVVKNIASFEKAATVSTGAETVNYDFEFKADEDFKVVIDSASPQLLDFPEELAYHVDLGEFALMAYPWTDIAKLTPANRRSTIQRVQATRLPGSKPVGTLNRYYVGEYTAEISDGTTTDVRFTHRLIANGATTILDFAGMGNTIATLPNDQEDRNLAVPDDVPTQDFQAGDKIIVNFSGGALGLPQPGAKVVVAIPDPTPGEFTDDLLDAVHVVPNPYLIDHLGQASSSDKKIYFTRLPKDCTIEIYTVAGDLVKRIEHKAGESEREAVEAWDLVTRGNRQAETQLFVARITTPDGAETIKKFSIVVGGFQVFTQ